MMGESSVIINGRAFILGGGFCDGTRAGVIRSTGICGMQPGGAVAAEKSFPLPDIVQVIREMKRP
jgi:hypothetical protein